MGRAAPPENIEMPTSDPAMTSREAARMLGVSITTAQMWMERGMLASWKTPGGHRRTRLSSVMTLLSNCEIKQSDPSNGHAEPHTEGPYPVSQHEPERARLVEQAIADVHSETRFHRLTWFASELLDAPIASITFLTAELQLFHAVHGLNITATPRSWAFCNYAVMQEDIFTVSDATKDPRFANNPMVTSAPFIRFYASVRLMYHGKAFGSLCVIDTEPRILRAHERQALEELATLATDVLSLQILEWTSE